MKIFKKTFLILICMCCLLISMIQIEVNAFANVTINNGKVTLNSTNSNGETISSDDAKSTIIEKYKGLVTFFGGLGTITFVAIFIKHFIELGMKAANPMERKQITSGLIWSGIAAGCLGSVTMLFGLAYNVFK